MSDGLMGVRAPGLSDDKVSSPCPHCCRPRPHQQPASAGAGWSPGRHLGWVGVPPIYRRSAADLPARRPPTPPNPTQGDHILISEACNHNRITDACNDIGMVQIPQKLERMMGGQKLHIDHAYGRGTAAGPPAGGAGGGLHTCTACQTRGRRRMRGLGTGKRLA